MTDDGRSTTWKATLIGAAMTLATSTGGYISSHWGGVTKEQLDQSEGRITASVNKVESRMVAEGTRLQAYVDEKVAAAEERARVAAAKKKKRSNVDQ